MSHGPQQIVDMVEGDTEPFVILLPGINITGWAFELHIGYPGTPLSKPGTIITASPDGRVEVALAPTDLVTGRYPAEVQITKPGPIVLTSEQFVADIREQVA